MKSGGSSGANQNKPMAFLQTGCSAGAKFLSLLQIQKRRTFCFL
jgi:hypothetical protein